MVAEAVSYTHLKDAEAAVAEYLKSAEQGYAPGQCNLAFCYLVGVGCEADPQAAIPWLEKAAEQEHPRALGLLGSCYRDGNGVEQDLSLIHI